jgi:hypothetical protein
MSAQRDNLAWAAGLFEGEGSISIHQRRNGIVHLAMTDADVVERFAKVMGFGRIYHHPQDKRKATYKPLINWVAGSFEHVQAAIAMMWPWLGTRRQSRAIEVLRVAQTSNLACKQRTHCPKGHPYSGPNLRISQGRRMCRTCRGESGFR